MEEILSSIKRIIAEEGDGTPVRPRRPQRAAVHPPEAPVTAPDPLNGVGNGQVAPGWDIADEVLELSEPMPQPAVPPMAQPAAPPVAPPQPAPADSILSTRTADATRGSLDALSRLVVRADGGGDGTLEGLVRDMLRPMLREWLDARLPDMVEELVSREIAKITGQTR